ncbi:LamG-like jellyroll fold domain-containing protein [Propionivibrio sp.]|uniref:LamG-like jellyroll fold domain-containing protein n=1 Tax=Propionivibrio sp. TaxID=2212460 RepID=UPI003BF42B9D
MYSLLLIVKMGAVAWGYKEFCWFVSYVLSSPFLRFAWSGTTLTVDYRNSTESASGDNNTYWSTVFIYTPVGGLTGFHSINCAMFMGGISYLYVDGVRVATADTSAVINIGFTGGQVNNDSYRDLPSYGLFGASVTVAGAVLGTGQSLAARGLFGVQVSAAQALELHNAFFTKQIPLVTGYAKEVILDGAAQFHICDSPAAGNALYSTLHPYRDPAVYARKTYPTSLNGYGLSAHGTLATGIVSPLAGRTATNFTNGVYRGQMACLANKRSGAFEFVIRRTTTAFPTAAEYIAIAVDAVLFATYPWHISQTTTKRLIFSLLGTVSEAISPVYVLPDNVYVHVHFFYDRPNGLWRLYINGALQESGVTASTSELTDRGFSENLQWDLMLGGTVSNEKVRSSNFKGDIAAFAVFPGEALVPARILAHYEAMGVV